MPKMMVFSGKGNREPFIFQFDRIANRYDWRQAKKTEKLLDCLSDQALEYAQKRGLHTDYETLRQGLSQRFMNKDTATVARKQLHSMRQREDETLEGFSQRVHFLTLDGHPEANDPTVQQIAIEAFLLGCKDKRAAETVMEREPSTIYEAQTMVKTSSNNHKALFGSRQTTQRQVVFVDEAEAKELSIRQVAAASEVRSQQPGDRGNGEWKRMQEDIKELKSHYTQIKADNAEMKQMLTSLVAMTKRGGNAGRFPTPFGGTPPSSPGGRGGPRQFGSPRNNRECFFCHEPGHFQSDCPKRRELSPGVSP